MRVCINTATGKLLSSQAPSPEDGVLIARAAAEFPEIDVRHMEERDVSGEEFAALCAPPPPGPDAAVLSQIATLEALQTPRLLREALLGKTRPVNKPGCCIDGMSPTAAVAYIDTQLDVLRAQLAEQPLYQNT